MMTKDEELQQMTMANKFLTGVVDIYHSVMDRKRKEVAQDLFPKCEKEIVIRYIHMPDSYPREGATGMTVAYARSENSLIFSWSFVIGKDVYSKSIGRERSSDNLVSLVKNLEDGLDYSTFIDIEQRIGAVSFSDFLAMSDMTGAISDDLLEKMTYMHFKHAYLTHGLKEFILDHIND